MLTVCSQNLNVVHSDNQPCEQGKCPPYLTGQKDGDDSPVLSRAEDQRFESLSFPDPSQVSTEKVNQSVSREHVKRNVSNSAHGGLCSLQMSELP